MRGASAGDVVANEVGELGLGGAVADDQDFMGRLQRLRHGREVVSVFRRMARADRARLVMDVALPVRRANAVFRHVVLCDLEHEGLAVVYADDGVEMMSH